MEREDGRIVCSCACAHTSNVKKSDTKKKGLFFTMNTTSRNRPNSTVLKSVSKPGRYSGGEYGAIHKDKASVKARFAFCFPDSYEIGMSNLGVRLLYGSLNQHEDIWCERAYTPWVDMQEKMREVPHEDVRPAHVHVLHGMAAQADAGSDAHAHHAGLRDAPEGCRLL